MIKKAKLFLLIVAVAFVGTNIIASPLVSSSATDVAAIIVVPNSKTNNAGKEKSAKAELKKELKAAKKEAAKSKGSMSGKSKIVAALLAFFLGGLGIHSFYMGNKKKGLIQLGLGILGYVLFFVGVIGAASSVSSGSGTGTGGGIVATLGYVMLVGVSIWAFVDFIRILMGKLTPEEGFDD